MRLLLTLLVSSIFCQFAHADRLDSIPAVSYFEPGLQSPALHILGTSQVYGHLKRPLPVSRLSTADIQKSFAWLKASNLPFLYPKDCCHSRAHLMSKWLSENGLQTVKVFAVGDLLFQSPYYGKVSWQFHVAPALLNEKKEWIVLDPSTQSGPVPYAQWLQKINLKKGLSKVYFTSPYVYQPDHLDSTLNNWDASLMGVANLELLGCQTLQDRAIRSGFIRR